MKLELQSKEERELYKALTSSSNASRIAMYHGVAEVLVAGIIRKFMEVKDGKISNRPLLNVILRETAIVINEEAILSLDDFNRIMGNVFRFRTSAFSENDAIRSPLACLNYFEVLGLPNYFGSEDIAAVNENMTDFKIALSRTINVAESILKRVSDKLNLRETVSTVE